MSDPQKPSTPKLVAAFAAIYFIWGSTYLFIKFALETMPPFALAATRLSVAGALLYAWSITRSDIRPTRVHWIHGAVLGFFLLTVGNGAVVWSQQRVPSGIAALVVAVVPLWVVVINWLRPGGKRPNMLTAVGVIIGLIGMTLLIGPGAIGKHEVDRVAGIVLIIGSLSWSAATVFGKRAAVPAYPALASAIQLLGGGLALAVVSLVTGEFARINSDAFSLQAILSISYLIVFGSIIAFSAYSWLLRVAHPSRIATYAYVNPVVAIFLGWLFADEALSLRILIAAGVILGGVVLITTGVGSTDQLPQRALHVDRNHGAPPIRIDDDVL